MSRKRKVYSASFRVQVALSAMKGDKTINALGDAVRGLAADGSQNESAAQRSAHNMDTRLT